MPKINHLPVNGTLQPGFVQFVLERPKLLELDPDTRDQILPRRFLTRLAIQGTHDTKELCSGLVMIAVALVDLRAGTFDIHRNRLLGTSRMGSLSYLKIKMKVVPYFA